MDPDNKDKKSFKDKVDVVVERVCACFRAAHTLGRSIEALRTPGAPATRARHVKYKVGVPTEMEIRVPHIVRTPCTDSRY